MTIQDAKKYLKENQNGIVISPMGGLMSAYVFFAVKDWPLELVFGEWKVKREPREIWVNQYGSLLGPSVYHSKEAAKFGGNLGCEVCKFVEVIE